MCVPAGQCTSPHVMSPSSTNTTWSLLWPCGCTIMPGSHCAYSERKRCEKSSHFSRTDASWSPCRWRRTSCHFRSSRWTEPGAVRHRRSPVGRIVDRMSLRILGTRQYRGRPAAPGGAHVNDRDHAGDRCHRRRDARRRPARGAELTSTCRSSARVWLDHLVLFFRDQHIDDEQQLAFALRFGTLDVSPFATVHQDTPEVVVLDQVNPKGEGADEWHSDNTFLADPPMGSILRGGATPRCRRRHVLREHVRGVRGPVAADAVVRRRTHAPCTTSPSRCRRRSATATRRSTSRRCSRSARRSSTTSSVTHPETGRKALFVNRNSTTHIVGLSEREQRGAAAVPVRPRALARVPVPVPLGGGLDRDLGQPLGAALRSRRLPRTADHAPRHDRGTGGAVTVGPVNYAERYLSEPGADRALHPADARRVAPRRVPAPLPRPVRPVVHRLLGVACTRADRAAVPHVADGAQRDRAALDAAA